MIHESWDLDSYMSLLCVCAYVRLESCESKTHTHAHAHTHTHTLDSHMSLRLIYEANVWHDCFSCVTWVCGMSLVIHLCDMTHRYVRHDSFICGRHDALICVTRLLETCDMTIDVCDMTHWCVWHDSSMLATWLIDTCDMTHWYVQHDS